MNKYKFYIVITDIDGTGDLIWTEVFPIYSGVTFNKVQKNVNTITSLTGELTFVADEFTTIEALRDYGKLPIYVEEYNGVDYDIFFRGNLLLDGDYNYSEKKVNLITEQNDGLSNYEVSKDNEYSSLNWKTKFRSRMSSVFEFVILTSGNQPTGGGWDEFLELQEDLGDGKSSDITGCYFDYTYFMRINHTVRIWFRERVNTSTPLLIDYTTKAITGLNTFRFWRTVQDKSYKGFTDINKDLKDNPQNYVTAVTRGGILIEQATKIIIEDEINTINVDDYYYLGTKKIEYGWGLLNKETRTVDFFILKSLLNTYEYGQEYKQGITFKNLIKGIYKIGNITSFNFNSFNLDAGLRNGILLTPDELTQLQFNNNKSNEEDQSTKISASKFDVALNNLFYTYNKITNNEATITDRDIDFIIEPILQKTQTFESSGIDLRNFKNDNFVENIETITTNVLEKPKRIIRDYKESRPDFKGEDIIFNDGENIKLAPLNNSNENISISDFASDITNASANTSDYSNKFILCNCDIEDQLLSDSWTTATYIDSTEFEISINEAVILKYNGDGFLNTLAYLMIEGFPEGSEGGYNVIDNDYYVLFSAYKSGTASVRILDNTLDSNDFAVYKRTFTVKDTQGLISGETIHNGGFSLSGIDAQYLAEMPYNRALVNGLVTQVPKAADFVQSQISVPLNTFNQLDFNKSVLSNTGIMKVINQTRGNDGFDIIDLARIENLPNYKVTLIAKDTYGNNLSGASVLINGSDYILTDGTSTVEIKGGYYTIVVSATGYNSISEEITIFEDKTITSQLLRIGAFNLDYNNDYD